MPGLERQQRRGAAPRLSSKPFSAQQTRAGMALMRAQRGRWGRGRAARVEGAGGGKAEGAHEGGWRREEGPPAGEGASTRASEAGKKCKSCTPGTWCPKIPSPLVSGGGRGTPSHRPSLAFFSVLRAPLHPIFFRNCSFFRNRTFIRDPDDISYNHLSTADMGRLHRSIVIRLAFRQKKILGKFLFGPMKSKGETHFAPIREVSS